MRLRDIEPGQLVYTDQYGHSLETRSIDLLPGVWENMLEDGRIRLKVLEVGVPYKGSPNGGVKVKPLGTDQVLTMYFQHVFRG